MMDDRGSMDDGKEQTGNIDRFEEDQPYDVRLVRMLNDALRRRELGGNVFVTRGVGMLPRQELAAILQAVACFDDFNEDNDPYGEHDCAVMTVGQHRIIWKIDYYDRALKGFSPDPSNPHLTRRILTVMLASEY